MGWCCPTMEEVILFSDRNFKHKQSRMSRCVVMVEKPTPTLHFSVFPLNWPKWYSQHVSNVKNSDSSICKGKFPHSTHVSIRFAHQWTSEVFNIFHGGHANFEFGKPCHSHCLLSKSYCQHCNIFSHFRVKLDANMLLFQVYFLS